jgi:hypothetical protein
VAWVLFYNPAIAMNPFFDWLKDSSTQAILVLVGTVAACIAAAAAIWFGRIALVKKDLDDLEGNTAATSSHLSNVDIRLTRVEENTAATAVQLSSVRTHLATMNQDLKRVEENTAEMSNHLENVHSHVATMNERMDTQHERDALIARANRVPLRICGSADQGKGIVFSVTTQDANVLLSRVDLYNESGNKFGSAECQMTENPLQVFVSLNAQECNKWLAAGSMINNSDFDRIVYLRVYMKFKGVAEEIYRPMTAIGSIEIPPAANPLIRLRGEV